MLEAFALIGCAGTFAGLAAVFTLALKSIAAKDGQRAADVASAELRAQAVIDAKALSDVTAAHQHEQERADALDNLLSNSIAGLSVDGAYKRLLQKLSGGRTAVPESGHSDDALPSRPAAGSDEPRDALVRPE